LILAKKKDTSKGPAEFESPCLVLHLRMTARAITRLYNRVISITGIEMGEFALLVAVKTHPNKSITELARMLSFERTTMVRNSKNLAKRGFIVPQAGTGRAVHYKLTKLGLKKYKESLPFWSEIQNAVEGSLRTRNGDELRSILKDVRNVIHNHTS